MPARNRLRPLLLALLAVALTQAPSARSASDAPSKTELKRAQEALPQLYREWLIEVAPIITEAERRAFLTLDKDYQREAFIERFWKVRDPCPDTARNELREAWDERVAEARQVFGGLDDERAEIFLLNGPPAVGFQGAQRRQPAAEIRPPRQRRDRRPAQFRPQPQRVRRQAGSAARRLRRPASERAVRPQSRRAGLPVGTENRIGQGRGCADSARAAIARAREQLRAEAALLKLSETMIAEAEVIDAQYNGNGPAVVRFKQKLNGVEVFGRRIAVMLDRSGTPVAVSGYFATDYEASAAKALSFKRSAAQAISAGFV